MLAFVAPALAFGAGALSAVVARRLRHRATAAATAAPEPAAPVIPRPFPTGERERATPEALARAVYRLADDVGHCHEVQRDHGARLVALAADIDALAERGVDVSRLQDVARRHVRLHATHRTTTTVVDRLEVGVRGATRHLPVSSLTSP